MIRLSGTLLRSRLLFALAFTVTVGCHADSATALNAGVRKSISSGSTPEQVFRAIMLGEGSLADQIPEIASDYKIETMVTPYLSISYLQGLHNRIVSRVNTIDGSFMPRFKNAMESGDPNTVSQFLDDAAAIIMEALKNMPEGQSLRYYAENPSETDSELDGSFDGNGLMDIGGDTAVTLNQTHTQLTSTSQVGYVSGGGGLGGDGSGCFTGVCQTSDPQPKPLPPDEKGKSGSHGKVNKVVSVDPNSLQPRYIVYGVSVAAVAYIAAAVHVIVVYNAAVVIFQGVYVAFDVPKWFPGGSWRKPTLKKEQLVNSITELLGP
jgi:SdpC family antimicrobial peptide